MLYLFLIALASSFLSSCSCTQTSSPDPYSLNIAIYDEPTTLSPEQAKRSLELSIAKLLFEGLTRENHNKEELFELALADSYISEEEEKRHIFHLKEALWSDGSPLLAHDVVKAWEHAQIHSPHQEIFQGLSFFAPAPTTGIVISDVPYPDLPKLLAFPAFAIYQPQYPHIYSGPFILEKHVPGQSFSFKKNPYYYDVDIVPMEKIQLIVLPDIYTARHLMSRGKIHWLGQPWHQGIPKELQTHPKILYHNYPVEGTFWLSLNINSPQLSNPVNRYRLAAAINKEALIKDALEGSQQPAYTISKHSETSLPSLPSFSLSLAQETLTLTYPINILRCQRIAEVLREQLRASGIYLNLNGLEYHCFLNKRNLKDYTLATQTRVAYYPKATLLPNEAQKLQNLEIIPLYHLNYDFLSLNPIKNILFNASGAVDLKYASIEELVQ